MESAGIMQQEQSIGAMGEDTSHAKERPLKEVSESAGKRQETCSEENMKQSAKGQQDMNRSKYMKIHLSANPPVSRLNQA